MPLENLRYEHPSSGVFSLAKYVGPRTQPSLLRRIKDLRDQAAWRDFVDLYSPWINGWCRHCRKLSQHDAADLTQEILCKLTRVMPAFEYDSRGRFRSWLATLMCRMANSHWTTEKHQCPRGGMGGVEDVEDPRTSQAAREAAKALDCEFVTTLAAHYLDRAEEELTDARRLSDAWRTFRLKYERERSDQEIATELGIQVTAVRMRLTRVRGWLQELGLDSRETIRELRDDP